MLCEKVFAWVSARMTYPLSNLPPLVANPRWALAGLTKPSGTLQAWLQFGGKAHTHTTHTHTLTHTHTHTHRLSTLSASAHFISNKNASRGAEGGTRGGKMEAGWIGLWGGSMSMRSE